MINLDSIIINQFSNLFSPIASIFWIFTILGIVLESIWQYEKSPMFYKDVLRKLCLRLLFVYILNLLFLNHSKLSGLAGGVVLTVATLYCFIDCSKYIEEHNDNNDDWFFVFALVQKYLIPMIAFFSGVFSCFIFVFIAGLAIYKWHSLNKKHKDKHNDRNIQLFKIVYLCIQSLIMMVLILFTKNHVEYYLFLYVCLSEGWLTLIQKAIVMGIEEYNLEI